MIRRLVRNTAGYSISTLVGPFFTLLLTPIYTRILTPDDYGRVDILLMMSSLLLQLCIAGLRSPISAFYYHPAHQEEQPRVLSSGLWTGLVWSVGLALTVFIGAEWVAFLTLNSPDEADMLRLIVVALPFAVVYQVQLILLQLRFQVWRANLISICYIVLLAATNVLFIVIWRWGSTGVIVAHALAYILTGLISLLVMRDAIGTLPSIRLIGQLSYAGLPLIPAGVAIWLLAYQDRIFLVRFVSLAEIGIYAIANKLASMLMLLVEPFRAAWLPLALSVQGEPDAPAMIARVFRYYVIGGLGLALALSLFAHEILLVFTTASYVDAMAYVWILALVPLNSGFNAIVSIGLLKEKRTGQLSTTIAAAALLNTALNALLIPSYGVMGAAIATAIGYLASSILAAYMGQRYGHVPYPWYQALLILLVYLGLAGAGQLIESEISIVSIGIRISMLCCYGVIVMGLFNTEERALLCQAVREPALVMRWLRRRGETPP